MTQEPGRPMVLVVEDDADVRGALADALQEGGYEVAMAANGREALHVLAHMEPLPCLILLDLVMPRLDGRQFLERLRADATLCHLPVLMVTATEEPALQGVELLRKPVKLRTLLEAVARYRQQS